MIPTKQFRFKYGKLQQAFMFDEDDVWLADKFHQGHIDNELFVKFNGSFSKWLDYECNWVTVQSID